MARYRVLDHIAYEPTANDAIVKTGRGRPVPRTAEPGEVVELTEKDAAALLARGAVVLVE